jgi:GTP-sensing pleiotropic transcriptional regulator CodY
MMVIIEKLNSEDERTALTPLQLQGQRVGDLVLDLARAAAHPVGEDDDLVLAQVGDGVHGRVEHGVDRPDRQRRRHEHDQEAVADRVLDQFFDHGRLSFPREDRASNGRAWAFNVCPDG